MLDVTAYLWSGTALLGIAGCLWLASVAKRDVSIVDSAWALMFLAVVCVYAATTASAGARTTLVLVLVTIWALRLSAHIAWRNYGKTEDQRYQAIRHNNEPGFWFKSIYIVFGLQALLAWIIATPLVVAVSGASPPGFLDVAGIALWLVGFGFESIGDRQLARFQRNPFNRGKVLDSGLWAYTRHPNYFGESLLWWGFYLIAFSANGWWTLFAPVLMTVLLLKVSGVALLEKDIADRRPAYADYIRRTNAFLPGPRRAPMDKEKHA